MNIQERQEFYDKVYELVVGGYDSRLTLRGSTTRFIKAIDSLGLLWFGDIAYWFNGRCFIRLWYKELKAAVFETFYREGVFISIKSIKDLVNTLKLRLEGRMAEPDRSHIALRNGILDLSLQRIMLKPHTKDIFITRYFDFDFDTAAQCPMWHAFLDEVLPDKTLQMVLQEFLGAIFLDRQKSKVEVMMWLYGDGANGKSVVFNTIMGVLGRENVSTRDMRDFCHATKGAYAISDLEGKLLNYCSDVQGEFTFTDIAKKIISGEAMHAERKYENARMIYDLPLLMANCNVLPKLGDKTNAWARRVKIIPFNVTIPEDKQDKELAGKLLAERSGIFAWMLEGRRRYVAQGYQFTISPQCDMIMQNYRTSGYEVLDFMNAEGFTPIKYNVGDEGKVLVTKDLYKVFRSWLEVNKAPEYAYITLAQFRTKLRKYGYIAVHTRDGAAIRAFSTDSPYLQKKRKKAIADEPALQVEAAKPEAEPTQPDISAATGEFANPDSDNRNELLDRIRKEAGV